MFNFSPRNKSRLSGVMLVVWMFGFLVSNLGFPQPAQAFMGVGDLSITAADIPRIAFEVAIKALQQVGSALKLTAIEISTFLGQKVAHDVAVQLVAGASGQKPLFNAKDAGTYILDLGKDITAQTLSSFAENLTGIDICSFDPKMTKELSLGFAQTSGPTGRKCDFKALSAQFNKIKEEAASFAQDPKEGFSSRFAVTFVPGNSTLDGFTDGLFGMADKVQKEVAAKKDAEYFERLGDVKAVKNPVTGAVKTPKELVQSELIEKLVTGPAADVRGEKESALQQAPEEILTIVGITAKTFIATLLGEASKKIFAGMAPTANPDLANPFAPSTTGIADAQQAMRSLLTVTPASVAAYDQIGLFASCPLGAGMHRNPDTCVMSQPFAAAVRRGTTSSAVTVRDALEQGMLQGDLPFIGPNDARNQDPNCYLQGYCYSNLVKLRRARIISIGWEMAAIMTEQERQGTTLAEVIKSFDGSNLQSFKHLIDPNWILKYPPTQCRQMVNGVTLLSDKTPNRHEVCVDTPSCVAEDGKGNCLGTYGYCTKEKNVWRFDGDACPKEMSSCLLFTRPDATKAAYLTNTTDASVCSSETAGCRNYFWNTAPTPSMIPVADARAASTNIISPSGTGNQFNVDPTAINNFSVGDLVKIAVGGVDKFVTITSLTKSEASLRMGVSEAVTWTTTVSNANPPVYTYTSIAKAQLATGGSVYLNKTAAACADKDKGCTELIDLTTKNTPANMLLNPGFETDDDANGKPDGWITDIASPFTTSTGALSGARSVKAGISEEITQYVSLQANSYYTFSAQAKSDGGSSAIALNIRYQNQDGSNVKISSTVDALVTSTNLNVLAAGSLVTYGFVTPTPFDTAQKSVIASVTIGATTYPMTLDDVQLEFGEAATPAHDNYTYDATRVFMKVPPAALECTPGNPNFSEDCKQYAGVCQKSDVGCESYTPVNGDPNVNGALSQLDLCPASCVGYDTFKQLGWGTGTNLTDDPELNNAGFETEAFPVYFSPTFPGAKACSMAAVGCDEFTNLQASTAGGEGKSYYSKLRKCQVETGSSDTKVYYTWEGSDTAGLQLKNWKLKKSGVSEGPCVNTTWVGEGTTYQCTDQLSQLTVDATTGTSFVTAETHCQTHADVAIYPDCREFYDDAGKIHYRLLSKTIASSDSCVQLRRTSTNLTATVTERDAECTKSGGKFTATSGTCIYLALPEGSSSCGAEEVGCRAYRGNAGSNTRQAYSETFESVVPDSNNHLADFTGTYSAESLSANGHSLSSVSGAIEIPLGGSVGYGTYQLSLWGKSSVATGSTIGWRLNLYRANATPGGADVLIQSYPSMGTSLGAVTNDWSRIVSDPIKIPEGTDVVKKATLSLTSLAGSALYYVDNIEIREIQNTVSFVKNSWTAPVECDQTPEGTASPQEMLGCRAYTDRANRRVAARSFSRLCGEDAVGCKAFSDTQNSVSIGQQIFGARCYAAVPDAPVLETTPCTVEKAESTASIPVRIEACKVLPGQAFCRFNTNEIIKISDIPDTIVATTSYNKAFKAADTVVVSSDKVKYLIDDPAMRCAKEAVGCYEFGAAQYSSDKSTVVAVAKKTMLNVPDKYATTLCGQEQNFCDAFAGEDGSMRYFKDPEAKADQSTSTTGKLCEYRDDVVIEGNHFAGWFKKGTDLACYTDFVVGGGFNAIRKNADPSYGGWVGSCQPNMSKCTEFRDPTDRSDEFPLGRSYYYMKNQRVTGSTCNQVSRREGCAMFEDTTNPTKLWNAEATYSNSDAASGSLVNAVSCQGANADNQVCKNRCRVSFSDLQGVPEPTRLITQTVCTRDEDCSGIKVPTKRVTEAKCIDIGVATNITTATFESRRDENELTRLHPLDNANMILKVRRDRECGEWLSCTTSSPIYDAVKQETKEICNEIRTCSKVVSTNGGGTLCSNFVDTPREALTRGIYVDRDISWKGGDLSGYTIPGMVPADRIGQVNVAGKCISSANVATSSERSCFTGADCMNGESCKPNADDPDLRLAHKLGTSGCSGDSANGTVCKMGFCRNNPTLTCGSAQAVSAECGNGECSFDSLKEGRCYDNNCVQLVGNAAEINNPAIENYNIILRGPEQQSCRAYPEVEGPVPATVITSWKKNALVGDTYALTEAENNSAETVQWTPLSKNSQYSGANVCAFAKTADGKSYRTCECRYSKATYGGSTVTKFYPQGTRSKIKPYICAGGKYDGAACLPGTGANDDPCGPEGACQALQKIDNASGELGYCLERDLSMNVNGENGGQACAVWLPVDALPGSVDMYNQDENAGFVPPEDDLYYCAEGRGRSTPNGLTTRLPYTNTFVDEVGGGIFCGEGPQACSNFDTEAACRAAPKDLLGNATCLWQKGKCKVVMFPVPTPPQQLALFPGCLPANGLTVSWDTSANQSHTSTEFLKGGRPQATCNNGTCTNPNGGNECFVDCTLEPVLLGICVKFSVPKFKENGTLDTGGFEQYPICPDGTCGVERNGNDFCDNAPGDWQAIKLPISPPAPSCNISVTNCCLPEPRGGGGGAADIVKGFITTITNLNPSTYKVCNSVIPPCPDINFSLTTDSCLDIDKLILATLAVGAGIAAITALIYVIPYIQILAVWLVGYVVTIFVVLEALVGSIAVLLFTRCAMLAVNNVCNATPAPDRFLFSALPSPLEKLKPVFPTPTPPPGPGGGIPALPGLLNLPSPDAIFPTSNGATGVRISPRLLALKLPVPGEPPVSSPIQAVLPMDLRKEEIAAVRITTPSTPDEQTKAIPHTFFLLPPKFEASFWWNGGDKEDTKATEPGKAIFATSYDSKCGDPGIDCKNVEKGAIPSNVAANCEYFFKKYDPALPFAPVPYYKCGQLAPNISQDNEGIENCAAIKARFGHHCSNSPEIGCNKDSDCNILGTFQIPTPGRPLSGKCVGEPGEEFFLGFQSGMCIRSNTGGGNMPVKVEVLLKETCDVVTKVAKSPETSINPLSTAYTDRVWEGSKPNFQIIQTQPPAGQAPDPKITYNLFSEGSTSPANDAFFPFGRLSTMGNGLSMPIPLYSHKGAANEPATPYTYLKNASEDKPPIQVTVVNGGPLGGYAYGCPEIQSGAANLVPHLDIATIVRAIGVYIVDSVIAIGNQIANKLPVMPGVGAPGGLPLLGICKQHRDLLCGMGGGTGDGDCRKGYWSNEPTVMCSASGAVDPELGTCNLPMYCTVGSGTNAVPDFARKCTVTADCTNTGGGTCLASGDVCVKPCVGNTCGLDKLAAAIKELEAPQGSRTCTSNIPNPLLSASGAKTLLNRIFAKSYGVATWSDPNGGYAMKNGYCSHNHAISCTVATVMNDCKRNGICTADKVCSNNSSRRCEDVGDTNECLSAAPSTVSCIDPSWDVRNPDLQSPATGLDPGAQAPKIYPIKQASCRPTDGKCMMDLASEGTITVNDVNDGVLSGANSMKATVKFYFEADKNHMPSKRIVIDWGDRTDTTDLTVNYGLYKNRVGLQQDGVNAGKLGCNGDIAYCSNDTNRRCSKDSECVPETPSFDCDKDTKKCKLDGTTACCASCNVVNDDEFKNVSACQEAYATLKTTAKCNVNSGFGRATRACEDNYISFSHTYTCDDTTYSLGITNATKAPAISIGTCANVVNSTCAVDADCLNGAKCLATGQPNADTIAQKCVFKPRVMVLDNWGWCNGKCVDAVVRSDICYSGDKISALGTVSQVQQCDIRPVDLQPTMLPNQNPWAKFNGTIEVRR